MSKPNETRRRTPDDIVNSALELMSVRAWPGPERNPRIEDHIMNVPLGNRTTTRKLCIGGLLLLLGGTAIGAATTSIITQRFTGYAEDADGNRFEVEGIIQIDQVEGEEGATITIEKAPDQPLNHAELRLEDGQVLRMTPTTTDTRSGPTAGPVQPPKK